MYLELVKSCGSKAMKLLSYFNALAIDILRASVMRRNTQELNVQRFSPIFRSRQNAI